MTSLLPVAIALIPFVIIIFLVYHFVGKKAGKITGLALGIIFLVALPFALFGGSSPTTSKSTLHIAEWHLNLSLTHDISDAYYALDGDEVYISTRQLDKLVERIEGCTSGLHGLYYKRDPLNSFKLKEGQHRAEPACAAQASAETDKISTLKEAIQAAAQTATAD